MSGVSEIRASFIAAAKAAEKASEKPKGDRMDAVFKAKQAALNAASEMDDPLVCEKIKVALRETMKAIEKGIGDVDEFVQKVSWMLAAQAWKEVEEKWTICGCS